MRRAELEVGGAYFHKTSQYGSGDVVIPLSTLPYVENSGYWRSAVRGMEQPRFRPANNDKGRYLRDNRNGVLVMRAHLPYGGYVKAGRPWDTAGLYWALDIVQLRDIQQELVPAGGDFDAVMAQRAQSALDAHRRRIEADHLRTQQHERETERCKEAIEGAGLLVSFTPMVGHAVPEVKFGKGQVTLNIADFEELSKWAWTGRTSVESVETRLSR